mgnify:CR=1 FL=1
MLDFTGMFGMGMMGKYGSSFLIANPLFLILGVALVFFWLWMFVDCLSRNFKKEMDKLVWIIVLLYLNILGAFLYYFLVKAKR